VRIKILDTSGIDTLYNTVLAQQRNEVEKEISMMTRRKQYEHTMPWQPSAATCAAAMCDVVCSLGLTSSATDIFGGRLGQETPINRRHTKH